MVPGSVPRNATFRMMRPVRLIIAFLLILTGVGYAPVVAQQENVYETELLGWTIEVSGPSYVLQNADLEEYPHGRGERVYITSVDSAGFVEVSFFDDEDTPEQTIELMLRDFDAASRSLEVLDTGFANDLHYALARFELEQGMSGYFYIEVAEDIDGNTDFAQSIYSLDADFLEQLSLAREEISLAGLQFLAEPVLDLETLVSEDQARLASTPEPVPTPDQGSYTYETNGAGLEVEGHIEFDFPLITRELDIMFLSSEHGYGVVGFIHQKSDSPETVMASVFVDAPVGAEAPVELYAESDDSRAFGVYRVQTQGETRAMVLEISSVSDGVWKVQGMAVTESEFETELANYQNDVTFNGEPLLGEVSIDDIIPILNDSD